MPLDDRLDDDAQALAPDLVRLRHRLHEHPEVGLDLPATQQTVLEAIDGLGLEITTGSRLSSVTAVLRGGRPGPAVLLRDVVFMFQPDEEGWDGAGRSPPGPSTPSWRFAHCGATRRNSRKRNPCGRSPMRVKLILLGVVVLALVATVWLPFVNASSLWLGLPSIMVWTAAWVLGITLVLALIEFTRADEDDDVDATDGGRP
jgi:hypothetical protein